MAAAMRLAFKLAVSVIAAPLLALAWIFVRPARRSA